MRRALQHSATLSICGLWIPRGKRRELNASVFEAFPLGAGEEPAAGEVGECGLSRQYGFGSGVLPPGPRARAGVDHRQQLRGVVPPGFAGEASTLVREVLSESREEEIALRPEGRYVGRLARWSSGVPDGEIVVPARDGPFRVEIDSPSDPFEGMAVRRAEASRHTRGNGLSPDPGVTSAGVMTTL